MTLAIGDHLRIQREGKLVEADNEAYHEYVVVAGLGRLGETINYVSYSTEIDSEGKQAAYVMVRLRVVK